MKFFETENARIAYDAQTGTETPTQLLLLLNGFQRPRQDFRALRRRLQSLAPHVATVVLDHRGSGQTESPTLFETPPSLELLASDAQEVATFVMREWQLSTYSVLGISMGGMVAQLLALKNPEIAKLILVSTSPYAVERLSHDIALRDYFGSEFSSSHIAMVESFVKSVKSSQESTEAQKRAAWQRAAIEKFNVVSSLKHVVAPTLIISGDDDVVIPHTCSMELSSLIPQSFLALYPQKGHVLLVEAAERLAFDTASFLNSAEKELQ